MITPATLPAWAAAPVQPDQDETLRALRLFIAPGDVVELRALGVVTADYRRPHTVSGYYDDLEAMARDAAGLAAHAKGVYFSLNPLKRALLARSCNRCRPLDDRSPTTADHDVERRRWLPIDFDPVRPSEVSASAEEHEAGVQRARDVYRHLKGQGWCDPITADSGNGAHLVYPIDLPRDDSGVVERVLKGLAFRFSDGAVAVDVTTFNPARIWKLYGTIARKGDHILDRPHRVARITSVPSGLEALR